MPRLLLAVLSLCLAACATTSQPEGDSSGSGEVDTSNRFGFMGLDDQPLQADWDDWTPAPSLAAPSIAPFVAFDTWVLMDRAESEQLWASLFTLLDVSRGYLPDEANPTVRELMTVLDPGSNPEVVTDVVFVVAADGEREGALVRVYREMPNGGSPGVLLELMRAVGGGDNPAQIRLHLHSGYAEAPSYRLDFGRPDSIGWSTASGEWNDENAEGIATELVVVRDIISTRFWRPLIGSAYVEPAWKVSRKPFEGPVDFPVGHGVAVDLRPIDKVLTDTVFPPRLDLEAPDN